MHIVNFETAYTYERLCRDSSLLCKEYPFLRPFSLGHSVSGRRLSAISWGEGEKRLFLNGAHHGMEWITSLLLMYLLEDFSHHYVNGTSLGNVDFRSLFHEVTMVFCPMVNPDGVELAINGLTEDLPPITKTRLKEYNGGSLDFSKWQANLNGVDLNHNYDASFRKGVFHQHSDSHRTNAAGYRSDRSCDVFHVLKVYVAAQFAFGIAIHTYVNDDRTFFYHISRYCINLTCCADNDIRPPTDTCQILCFGMTDGYSTVLLHQQHSHGLTNNIASANNHTFLAGNFNI